MNFNLKKLLKSSKGRAAAPDFGRVAVYSFRALFVVLIALLVLDGYIFYQYSYRISNDGKSGTYRIEIKRSTLEKVVAALKERQKKFAEAQGNSFTAPDPFR